MALITFTLKCDTVPGEDLFVMGNIPPLGNSCENATPLKYENGGWTFSVNTSEREFRYSYIIKSGDSIISKEPDLKRAFYLPGLKYKNIHVHDRFDPAPLPSRSMMSKPFSESIMNHPQSEICLDKIKVPIIFNVFAPNIPAEQKLVISGNDGLLGRWTDENMVNMQCWKFGEFSTVFDANKMFFPLEYKYVLIDEKSNEISFWEKGNNRCVVAPQNSKSADFIIVNDGTPDFSIPDFKGAGVSVPVFSLRSERGFGVGEFEDIKLLVDWAVKSGQKIIQTLPINDTTNFKSWKDSYPYSGISVFALHPMYLDLEQIGEIPDKKTFCTLRKELNAQKFVDYEAVNKHKWEIIRSIFAKDKGKTLNSLDFKTFHNNNKEWLDAYAVFSYLRDKFGTANFDDWGDDAKYSEKRVAEYCNPKHPEYQKVAIYQFVQYHLDKQLKSVCEYAHERGVALKGDIPIGVNRCSADVWSNPALFDCNGQAGAPPDYFSAYGQNWGFPIYNWGKMAQDNYSWWTKRLKKMAEYFDAYRIDHILGFFRIFRIPASCTWGLLGQFAPALPMSVKEIESFGLKFDAKKMTVPHLSDETLSAIFGEFKEEVQKKYFNKKGSLYTLKAAVDTQRKIEESIKGDDEKSSLIRKGLSTAACQVLFVEDYKEEGKYHPRISVQQSYAFKSLSEEDKCKMNQIYDNFFYQRNEEFWREEAKKKLPPLVSATNMLVCGEDLGMVPKCVHPVMEELEILSLEIQRMPKVQFTEFGNLADVPRMSVCTTSTHDMSTTRAWWEENVEQTQRFFNNVLNEYGAAPFFCEPWVCRQIAERHLASKALWVILPLQDWMAIDGDLRWEETASERINDPGNPDNYWRYRMHITLEKLISNNIFAENLKNMIKFFGR